MEMLWAVRETHFVLAQDPGHPVLMAEAHGAENRDRDAEAAFSKLLVLGFGVGDRFRYLLWYLGHFVEMVGIRVAR